MLPSTIPAVPAQQTCSSGSARGGAHAAERGSEEQPRQRLAATASTGDSPIGAALVAGSTLK